MKPRPRACCRPAIRCWPPPVTWAASTAWARIRATAAPMNRRCTMPSPPRAGQSTGTPTQTLSRAGTTQINISWQAEDPDGDRLVYALYFRGEDETQWKLMRANLHENSFALDGDVLADGKYFFRVVASDRE